MKRKFLIKIVMTLLVIFVITVSPVLAMTYSYDDLGRLTSVTYDSGQDTTYSYDSTGNMLSTTNSLSNKLVTSYSLTAQTGPAIIDSSHQTVALTVYNGTDVTNLVATFTLSDESSKAQVGSIAQVSGTTANDFTKPVIYKVTAADGSEQDWTVTVTVVANSANLITAYILSGQTGPAVIDSAKHTVDMTVYSGTDVTNLVATFTLSEGASAQVGDTAQVSGTTSNNFTNPVIYKVTAADGSEQDWTVTVTAGTPVGMITEALTVSNTTSSGITVALSPALDGLQTSNFILLDDKSQLVNIITATTTNSGITYTISAALTAGKTYTITATKSGYDFGTAQTVVVSSGTITETLTVSNTTSSGITVALSPALAGLTTSNFTLVDSSNNPVSITGATTMDNGATYIISATLTAGETYTLSGMMTGYDFGTAQTHPGPTVQSITSATTGAIVASVRNIGSSSGNQIEISAGAFKQPIIKVNQNSTLNLKVIRSGQNYDLGTWSLTDSGSGNDIFSVSNVSNLNVLETLNVLKDTGVSSSAIINAIDIHALLMDARGLDSASKDKICSNLADIFNQAKNTSSTNAFYQALNLPGVYAAADKSTQNSIKTIIAAVLPVNATVTADQLLGLDPNVSSETAVQTLNDSGSMNTFFNNLDFKQLFDVLRASSQKDAIYTTINFTAMYNAIETLPADNKLAVYLDSASIYEAVVTVDTSNAIDYGALLQLIMTSPNTLYMTLTNDYGTTQYTVTNQVIP